MDVQLFCSASASFAASLVVESLYLRNAQTWAEHGGRVGVGGGGAGGFHLSAIRRRASSEIFLTG